ncbi:cation:proton antiporter [Candidatus Bathyarchaeota archaeon]|nr:cation:proton antiporter [Candidatus Bathyarchaeota archaeon]
MILISLALFLAYISGIIYTHTGIPDTVWLIAFGVLLGPVLKLFDPVALRPTTPLLVVMALNLLMFEGGLNVDLSTFRESMAKSLYIGMITFALTTLGVGYLMRYIMPETFTLTQGLLFGAMIGGTSASTVNGVIGSIQRVRGSIGETRRFLVLESIVTDSLSIVTAMTLLRLIQMPGVPMNEGIKDIVFVFSAALVIGFFVGVLWVQLLDLIRNRQFNYIMTLAVLFIAYILGERVGGPGSGSVAALSFGVTLTNYPLLARRFGLRENVRVDKRRLRSFHEEITFLIRSFLFVFVGLEAHISQEYMLIGLGVAAALGVLRVASVNVAASFISLTKDEATAAMLVFSNGLTALVISQLPVMVDSADAFSNPVIYQNLAVPIVVATSIFSALAGPLIVGRGVAAEEPEQVTGVS